MTNWITTKEASEQLGVSQRTIQRYIKQGLLKTKTIKGKTTINDGGLEAVKTGGGPTDKRQNNDKRHDTTSDNDSKVSQGFSMPEGYILIDKDTLDAIKTQLKDLTNELKEMRTTQQLLIEKGLNLRQLPPMSDTTLSQNDTTPPRQANDIVSDIDAIIDTDEPKNETTDDTTTTQKAEEVTVAQVTIENAVETIVEPNPEPVKENKPEIKTVWQMIGDLFKK